MSVQMHKQSGAENVCLVLRIMACRPKAEKKSDPNQIWDDEEVGEGRLLNKVDEKDKRPRPKYDIRYRQKISSDDALGAPWSVQDNSSMSCRDIIVKVEMPDTKFSTVKLDVTRNEIMVEAPKFLLALPLSVKTIPRPAP